ncbi:hypothetical protein MC7420_3004 [Coleofasciculus chthonoplastes PCC 7420]|uniref:DUF2157 domain-containing protein n=1 Tax=Coleofasciculus chthonoplastes PCC 7420 TaxID=118168 RepID=B4VKN2_9CYAN|nr:DUF2157 domain-containing protein [Coleofasciculus chthonoplastes]EDX77680.1 hypothetical protein MC7420_3004 [Coleofasciculus chthonoplastes PCC 7420]
MPSQKFRRQLRQEAHQWQSEGLIDPSVYEQLAQRYQFGELETASRNQFVSILLLIGSILLGVGAIAFFAANWQVWSRELKVALLLLLFIGFNTAGFVLWQRPKGGQRRLGQILLMLGALILGVNMALISQLFQQNRPAYQLLLLWGVGVLGMAYSLRLTGLGILSALLITIGYIQGQGQPEFLAIGEIGWLRLMVRFMPVVAGVMFIPLAYWCGSRWIFRLGAIAVIYSLEVNLLSLNVLIAPAWVSAIACALPPALLWGYRDRFWRRYLPNAKSFESTARTLAIIFLSLLFSLLSFYWMWNVSFMPSANNAFHVPWYILVNLFIFVSITIWEWLHRWRQFNRTTSFVAFMIVISAVIPYWHLRTGSLDIAAVLTFNLMLLVLAIGIIRKGITQAQRRFFWGGLVLLTLQVLSRMVEYNTDLLFKSLVFLLCGCGIIAAGVTFEYYIRAQHSK